MDVLGVEPNAAMRERAEARGGRYVDGTAEATGLRAGCADLVVGGQCFHWFDLDRTLPEITRLLRRGGHAAAFWNVRGTSPFLAAYDRLLREGCGEYRRSPTATAAMKRLRARVDAIEAEFSHEQRLDRGDLLARAWSSSYVAHGVVDRVGFDRALNALFDRHAEGGEVRMTYRTRVIAWRRA